MSSHCPFCGLPGADYRHRVECKGRWMDRRRTERTPLRRKDWKVYDDPDNLLVPPPPEETGGGWLVTAGVLAVCVALGLVALTCVMMAGRAAN